MCGQDVRNRPLPHLSFWCDHVNFSLWISSTPPLKSTLLKSHFSTHCHFCCFLNHFNFQQKWLIPRGILNNWLPQFFVSFPCKIKKKREMIYVFIGHVVQHICNIYNICLMPMPFYGEKMEINYGNGFLFGVKLLRKRGRLKKILIILHSPQN